MPFSTTIFKQLPWVGGVNSSLDESMIPPNQLTVGDNLIFDTRGSRRKRDGNKHNWDSTTSGTIKLLGLHDFWFGTSSKTQRLISIGDNRSIRSYTTSGTPTLLTDGGTAWSGTLTNSSMITFNNLCIMAVSGAGNVLKKWSGTGDVADLDGTPPIASILREHLGRLFTNDKTNLDRLHYSPVHDHTLWNGNGDSGAFDIGVGDGDPEGITAIFHTFKGDLFIAKRTKLYRLLTPTNDPTTWEVRLVSSGIGCVSHNSVVPIDQDDIFFVSEKGIHSLVATDTYADFESTFVSIDIQKTFRDIFDQSRLKFIWGAYDPTINSVGFAVTENTIDASDSTKSTSLYGTALTNSVNNTVWLYNIPNKSWYRHPALSCQSLISVRDGSDNKQRFFLGTHISRVSKTKNGTNYDISHAAANRAIDYRVSTGLLYLDGNSETLKGFRRFYLYYKPVGTHQVTVNVKIDTYDQAPENSLSFSQSNTASLLGSTFVLGSSLLGYTSIMKAYSQTLEGVGKAVKLTITQSGIDQAIEIQGFGFEYEPLDLYPDNT